MYITRDKTNAAVHAAVKFTRDLHLRHGLGMDQELKYEHKLLHDIAFIIEGCEGRGFAAKGESPLIPPIIKERSYLDSRELLLRFVLSSMAHKHRVVDADPALYAALRDLSIMSITAYALGNRGLASADATKFQEMFINNRGITGDCYFGYVDRLEDRNYLCALFAETRDALVRHCWQPQESVIVPAPDLLTVSGLRRRVQEYCKEKGLK
jgi:hypothetical protein